MSKSDAFATAKDDCDANNDILQSLWAEEDDERTKLI